MRPYVKRILEFITAPKAVCMGCGSLQGSDNNWLCSACNDRLMHRADDGSCLARICADCGEEVTGHICRECGGKELMNAVSAYPYDEVIKRLVQNFKFKSVWRMDEWMAGEMEKAMESSCLSGFDSIAFVPLHPSRQRERGYNQSQKLAERLGCEMNLPCQNLIKRVRRTKQQARLSREQRRENLKGAFECPNPVTGSILLVDDVRTTGSTVSQCAKALKKAGAREVTVVTFASADTPQ